MDSDVRNPDGALHVRFQMLTIYQPYDSQNPILPNGQPNPRFTGSPVYKDVPHIEISVPSESGLCLNRVVEEVRPEHKARFQKQWAMFQQSQGDGEQVVGIRLSEWPAINRSRAEELRAMRYFTVEQIASASDAQIQGIGMDGISLRQKAQLFMKTAKDSELAERQSAEINKLREEQAEKEAAHNKQLEELKAQMALLLAGHQATAAAPKRKGRPPKAQPAMEAPQGA